MRKFWWIWILCGGCFTVPTVEEAHSDWSVQVLDAVRSGNTLKGMTYEQVACAVGTGARGTHYHALVDFSSQSADGCTMVVYRIHYNLKYIGYFSKGRLQILDDFELLSVI